jgi:hypothetical protein
VFFVGGPGEQQHCQDSLGLISQPLLQTTGGSVPAISALGQIMWIGCPCLASMLACFLLTLTQHSRWHLAEDEEHLLTFYSFPPAMYRHIQTTNAIEGFFSNVRQRTDQIDAFTTEMSCIWS